MKHLLFALVFILLCGCGHKTRPRDEVSDTVLCTGYLEIDDSLVYTGTCPVYVATGDYTITIQVGYRNVYTQPVGPPCHEDRMWILGEGSSYSFWRECENAPAANTDSCYR